MRAVRRNISSWCCNVTKISEQSNVVAVVALKANFGNCGNWQIRTFIFMTTHGYTFEVVGNSDQRATGCPFTGAANGSSNVSDCETHSFLRSSVTSRTGFQEILWCNMKSADVFCLSAKQHILTFELSNKCKGALESNFPGLCAITRILVCCCPLPEFPLH